MKKFFIIFIIILSVICISRISFSQNETEENQKTTEEYNFDIGTVTTESLKIRSGLSTENTQIGLLSKGDTVHIYDKIDNWYIIRTNDNLVGAVSSDYIEGNFSDDGSIETANTLILSQDEQIFLNLVNNQRIENNLPEFELDEKLLNLARLKANDLVENGYFSHTSPIYGTVFEMLRNNNISYSKASENIARNLTAEDAVKNLMNSNSHKNNILSQEFNYTGIAVVNNPKSGKVFVEIFISR